MNLTELKGNQRWQFIHQRGPLRGTVRGARRADDLSQEELYVLPQQAVDDHEEDKHNNKGNNVEVPMPESESSNESG